MINEILNLPDVSFIDDITLEDVQNQMVNDYQNQYKAVTGRDYALSRADPITLLLYACGVQIYQSLLYVDRSGKQDLLKYSYGEYLDNLAALKGIRREGAKPARTTVRFTLSGIRPESIGIPAGTKVTDGETYFETEEYAEIISGKTSIDVACECITAGISGNDIIEGTINILVDPIPYVASMANIGITSGGVDKEDDESLISRIYLAPSNYSVAGPEDAYIYWVRTYNSNIQDVYVDSNASMEVIVEFIMQDGALPEASMIDGVQNYLEDENIRPLTDKVIVKAPDTVNYDLDIKYMINSSDAIKANTIQKEVNASIDEYIRWQCGKIGRDINPSELIRRAVVAGAKRVEITRPVFTRVGKSNVAKLASKKVTYGGIEDD